MDGGYGVAPILLMLGEYKTEQVLLSVIAESSIATAPLGTIEAYGCDTIHPMKVCASKNEDFLQRDLNPYLLNLWTQG